MAREQAVAARRERNAALVEAMLLAAAADGEVSQVELESLLGRVMSRSEFKGTRPGELKALVEEGAARLAGAGRLDEVMASLRARLPDHPNRVLAFGLAAAVAFADRRTDKAEIGLLKTLQAGLGISEEEVQGAFGVVQGGGCMAEALAQPLERLYAEVMVMVSAADGVLKTDEVRALVESFAADPLFHDVSPQRAQDYVTAAGEALTRDGLPQRLAVLAFGIVTHTQRLKAFRLAARIAQASGKPSPAEARVLDMLQASFGLADDEVERLRKEA
ncbi:MAG: TerB family tellurite resistance protein, partial [Deltaproteobacteria bacterium]|nr:TerB family tellurite resistance protein [Deltaproteobacteria bacterium]